MRNSTIRVATFAGPGAEPVIRSVPWPQVQKNAALIPDRRLGVCGTDLHNPQGPLAQAVAVARSPSATSWAASSSRRDANSAKIHGQAARCRLEGDDPAADAVRALLLLRALPAARQQMPDPGCITGAISASTSRRICGEASPNTSMSISNMLPGTKVYKLPDDNATAPGALSEPLTSCIRAFNRAIRAGGFTWGDTVRDPGVGTDRHSRHRPPPAKWAPDG